MILEAIARLISGAAAHNTIASRTVEITFQKSPGIPDDDARGIAGLEWRVTSGGTEIQTGRTEDDGIVHVEVRGNAQSVLEVLYGGATVAQYTIVLREGGYEADTELIGTQRRLRQLGYQLGTAGASQDGIDGSMGRKTDKAVQDFQIDSGLAFDSVIGAGTRDRLNDEVGGSAETA